MSAWIAGDSRARSMSSSGRPPARSRWMIAFMWWVFQVTIAAETSARAAAWVLWRSSGELGRSEEEIAVYDELLARFTDAPEPTIGQLVEMARGMESGERTGWPTIVLWKVACKPLGFGARVAAPYADAGTASAG